MTVTPHTPDHGPTFAKGRKIEPMKALAAFRRLVKDKEDTAQVFLILRALTGKSIPRGYARLIRQPGGGELAYARVELAERFADEAWLDGFAPGTVGAAYRSFLRRENLSPKVLAEISLNDEPMLGRPHPVAWYARRQRDIHDVWHILTGYGRDALGEVCLLAFTYAQTGSLGFLFLFIAAAQQISRSAPGQGTWRAVYEAWRNGRKAAWLPAQDYERLFAEPLEAARRRLNLTPPGRYEAVPEALRRTLTLQGA
jgi:ubiquinone biosynthesis protein COQ4